MKNCSSLLCLISALGTLATPAFGATYFLPGVSVEGGWHDAEKEWGFYSDGYAGGDRWEPVLGGSPGAFAAKEGLEEHLQYGGD